MAENVGIAPPAYDTAVGQVRALIGDTVAVNVASGSGEYMWYGDSEITGLLAVYSDNPKRAAAQALRTIAASQALLLKKWSTDDLSVDGTALAARLRDLARDLDDQADNSDASAEYFELSYPGGTVELWPEGFPVEYGARVGRAVETVPAASDPDDGSLDGGTP